MESPESCDHFPPGQEFIQNTECGESLLLFPDIRLEIEEIEGKCMKKQVETTAIGLKCLGSDISGGVQLSEERLETVDVIDSSHHLSQQTLKCGLSEAGDGDLGGHPELSLDQSEQRSLHRGSEHPEEFPDHLVLRHGCWSSPPPPPPPPCRPE